jgi:hypothetical protein
MCYVHNQWYDISCATLYICSCAHHGRICGSGIIVSLFLKLGHQMKVSGQFHALVVRPPPPENVLPIFT